jgi:hypothetical protein
MMTDLLKPVAVRELSQGLTVADQYTAAVTESRYRSHQASVLLCLCAAAVKLIEVYTYHVR